MPIRPAQDAVEKPYVTKFKDLLKELFRLDRKDLDFGIYRVLRARAEEIEQFIDERLLSDIQEGLRMIEAPSERLEAEREVYEHLYRFFRRYYSEGDFISQRIYREGTYAIPYSGEEVMLHWANKDQYYVKSAEHLRDYSFVIDVNGTERKVHFKLVDVEEGEHGNVKPLSGKERRFMLLSHSLKDFEGDPASRDLALEGNELTVKFAYRQDGTTQKALGEAIVNSLAGYSTVLDFGLSRDILTSHVNSYVARNTFDFFIHKDLGGFLNRELDHFVKTEVLELDDVERLADGDLSRNMSRVRVLRLVAGKLIRFLASLEDFQKKLWLKKKFVVETNYCITIDLVPEKFYPEIVANKAQLDEWVRLFEIDIKLIDIASIRHQKSLVLDTCFFSVDFKDRLIDSLIRKDASNSLLINSESSQALRLISTRYNDSIHAVYMDPPYNTPHSKILYKNQFDHSAWLSMVHGVMSSLNGILIQDFSISLAIDDYEYANLISLTRDSFSNMDISTVVIKHHPQGSGGRLSRTHEYLILVSPPDCPSYLGAPLDNKTELWSYKRSGRGENNFRQNRWRSFYAILLDDNNNVVGIEEPPRLDMDYPKASTNGGLRRIYPLDGNNVERVWRNNYDTALLLLEQNAIVSSTNGAIQKVVHKEDKRKLLFSIWDEPVFNAGTHGTNLLASMGLDGAFDYPKSIHAVETAIWAQTYADKNAIILDPFAGSGTTAHATLNLNRFDKGSRKFILMEMGYHCQSATKPRILKSIYSGEWLGGRPSRDTGISHCFKYIRLESYEDTLNNLELKRTDAQENSVHQGEGNLYEEYMLSYLFNREAQGNALLSTSAFKDPTAYTLNIKRPGGEESVETTVDLIETFNWLIGLRVHHMRAPITTHGWHRLITGELPNGQKALIIWRKLTDKLTDDNLKLNELFTQTIREEQRASLDVIYVNGSCTLDNVKTGAEHWKIELLDEHFTRLMFDTSDVEG